MTSIKPPNSAAPTAPHLSTPGAAQSSTGAAGASFRDALGQAQAQAVAGQTGVAPAAGSGHADPIAALSQQVKSGQLSMDQAIDQLVERAADGVGRHLSAAQRDELRDVVRQALSFDPTLSALRSEG